MLKLGVLSNIMLSFIYLVLVDN